MNTDFEREVIMSYKQAATRGALTFIRSAGLLLFAIILSWLLWKAQIANLDPALLFIGVAVIDLLPVSNEDGESVERS